MVAKDIIHCQCCGEEQDRRDMLNVCLGCVQAKFIPRGQWETIGFDGVFNGYTDRGWWDKIICANTERIKEAAIKKAQEIEARRAFMSLYDNDEFEDDENSEAIPQDIV